MEFQFYIKLFTLTNYFDRSSASMKHASIGRVRKIAVEKGRPSTSLLITGVSQVHTCAGSSESDHSGVTPVEIHWSVT